MFCIYASAAHAATEALYFALSVAASAPSSVRPLFRPVPNIFISLRKNTERIFMKFAEGNHYHEQVKLLHFGQAKLKHEQGSRI